MANIVKETITLGLFLCSISGCFRAQESNELTHEASPSTGGQQPSADHCSENANEDLKPEKKYLFRKNNTVLDQETGERIAADCALQLHVNSNRFFVGEPLHFSISIGEERPPGFEHEFRTAFLECENPSGKVLHFPVRYAGAGMSYAPMKGRIYHGMICPAVYPKGYARNFSDIQEVMDYFAELGDYKLRAWVWTSAGFQLSSQEVKVSFSEPNDDEARSVKYLKQAHFAFLSPRSSFIRLPVKDFEELSGMVTSDPNLPLRDELAMLLAGATIAYMQDTMNYEPRLIQQELHWRANTPINKPWLRWIANANGEFISKYYGFVNQPGFENIDWELLLKSWTDNPPLLTQLADYEMEYYDKRIAALEKICERRAEQRELGFLPK